MESETMVNILHLNNLPPFLFKIIFIFIFKSHLT
jgi:hypothetical protein